MNLRRSFDGLPRSISLVAGAACCLIATTLSAQGYGPQYGALPASHRIPMLSARPQTQYPYCPPGQNPSDYMQRPQMPSQPGQRQPQPGVRDDGQQRQDTSDPSRQQPQQDQQSQQPQQQNQQQDLQPTDFQPSDAGSRANPTPGMNTPQLGRNDAVNRMNLFDNMAAAPQSRAWVGVQSVRGFDTGLRFTNEFQNFAQPVLARSQFVSSATVTSIFDLGPDLSPGTPDDILLVSNTFTNSTSEIRRDTPADVNGLLAANGGVNEAFFEYNQRLWRVGAEWAPNHWFSVAVQGQRYATDDDGPGEEWTNPQIVLKGVLAQDCDTMLSATLGITPQTETEFREINENTTKFYPGLLFYEGLTPKLFAQGGAQFGLPIDENNQVFTADWSIALGYWLYSNPHPSGPGCGSLLERFRITGIVPQINLLGKQTIGERVIVGPYGLPRSIAPQQAAATEFVTITSTERTFLTDAFDVPISPETVTTTVTPLTPLPTVFTQAFPDGFIIYEEQRNVIDLTVGGQIMFGHSILVGGGYSLPLTINPVRQGEFLGTLTYLF